jgi:hypothetical protein
LNSLTPSPICPFDSAAESVLGVAEPKTSATVPGPRLAALIDHLGPGTRCELDAAQGHARLISPSGTRSTELRFAAWPSDDSAPGGPGGPGGSSALRHERLERLAAGALHLLQREIAFVISDSEADRHRRATFWPLPRELVLDADVLRAGERFIARHDAVTDQWCYDGPHLREMTTLMEPSDHVAPLHRWLEPNLLGVMPDVGDAPGAPAHDRLYVAQLTSFALSEIKPKDLPRTRILQMTPTGEQRLAEAPRVGAWQGESAPTVRLALVGGSRVEPDTGDMTVGRRTSSELVAAAVEAMKVLSRAEGLDQAATPQHISLIACYLDNGAFAPFGARFLEEAAGPDGFNHPGLTVSVRTNAILPGEGEQRGRLRVLGPGGDARHRQPGGTLHLSLVDGKARSTAKVEEDGRSFVVDTGQDARALLAWWGTRMRKPAPPVDDASAFLMGEVAMSRQLLDRMGAVDIDGKPLRSPDARADAPGACLVLRFDANRLMEFLGERSSPIDTLQALRLIRQCLRAGQSPVGLCRGDRAGIDACVSLLTRIRNAVDEDLLLPPAIWTSLWPAGCAPELPARPDRRALSRDPDPRKALSVLKDQYVRDHLRIKSRLRDELEAARTAQAEERIDRQAQ